jgi:exopolysaccharide biosynthesis protein
MPAAALRFSYNPVTDIKISQECIMINQNINKPKEDKNSAPASRKNPSDFGWVSAWPYEPDQDFQRAFDEIRSAESGTAAKSADEKPNAGHQEKESGKRPRKAAKRICLSLMMLVGFYCIAVFSNIPFVSKWRTIYIETAMSTMTHHWLATAFIPKSVIDKVMLEDQELAEQQTGLSSNWSVSPLSKKDLYLPWKKEKNKFSSIYGEIDPKSFNAYMSSHGDEAVNEDGYLVIDKADLKDNGTSIKTIYGDEVLAIDTKNAITIVKVTGEGYVGRLAIVKDPSRVGIGLSKGFDQRGATVGDIAEYNNAVLGINASGFYDPDGKGNGSNAYGLVISDGKVYKKSAGSNYKMIALDKSDKLNIGQFKSVSSFRDAVEFKPALIIDGKVLVEGSAGWGIQPRSAVGQTKNGEFLILIVDGRAPGYSIGCTVGELAQIMNRYGAYQACNLDGGSSSLMYYNGRVISKPSAANKTVGRAVPNGFVVYDRTK